MSELNQLDYFSNASENDLKLLAEHAHKKVLSKISELRQRIFAEEVFPKGKEYWYEKARVNPE